MTIQCASAPQCAASAPAHWLSVCAPVRQCASRERRTHGALTAAIPGHAPVSECADD